MYKPALEKTAAVGVARCCQSDQPPPSHYIPHLTPHVSVTSAREGTALEASGDLCMSSPMVGVKYTWDTVRDGECLSYASHDCVQSRRLPLLRFIKL